MVNPRSHLRYDDDDSDDDAINLMRTPPPNIPRIKNPIDHADVSSSGRRKGKKYTTSESCPVEPNVFTQCGYLTPIPANGGYYYYAVIGGINPDKVSNVFAEINQPTLGMVVFPGDIIYPWSFQFILSNASVPGSNACGHTGVIVLPVNSPLVGGRFKITLDLC